MSSSPYRWVVLVAGAVGAAAFAALRMGLPALGPALRAAYDLSLPAVGVVLAAVTVGTIVTLVPWGLLTDRAGERLVIGLGMTGCAGALVLAAYSASVGALLAGLVVAGMLGASSTGASGRAIMGWFSRSERGFALGVRQMALPVGGGLASLALPWLVDVDGLRGAFLTMAGVSLTGALVAAVLMRDPPPLPAALVAPNTRLPIRDRRLWRLGAGGAMLVAAQSAMLGFLVLFLHDVRGLSAPAAAAALAGVQLLGAGIRLVAGRRSDREGLRIAPMRRIAARNTALLGLTAAVTHAPAVLLYPTLLCAVVSTMSWNGLAFTAAGEISGLARAGTAMSMQNMILAVGSVLAPVAFGALVDGISWTAAFAVLAAAPLLAVAVLAPLEADEHERIEARRLRHEAAAIKASAQPLEVAP